METHDPCIKCGHECCKWIGWTTSEMSGRSLEFYIARGAKVLSADIEGKRIYRIYIKDTCPHLVEGEGCAIYARRPLACIEFEGKLDPLTRDVCAISAQLS